MTVILGIGVALAVLVGGTYAVAGFVGKAAGPREVYHCVDSSGYEVSADYCSGYRP